MRIQIRESKEERLLRAWIADENGNRMLVSTLDAGIASACPKAFEEWKDMLGHALESMMRDLGFDVLSSREEIPKPAEEN